MASLGVPVGAPKRILGLPRAAVLWTGTIALLLGTLYSASPASAWFVVAMALLMTWAGKGLSQRERRWVLGPLGIAAVSRGLVVAALPFATDHTSRSFVTFFPDALYSLQRSLWIRNAFVGAPVAPRDLFEAFDSSYGFSGYNYILAYVHLLFGPSPYGAHLFSAAAYLTGVVILHRQVRRSYGPLTACIGLITLLFLPSLFVWSVSPLWESLYVFLVAVLIVTLITIARTARWRGRLLAALGSLVALATISSLRSAGLIIAVGGVLVGLAARALTLKRQLVAGTLVAVSVLGLYALSRPDVQSVMSDGLWIAASRHFGHVNTMGHAYRLLDEEFYSVGLTRELLGPGASARFLIRAIVRFFTVPEPWILRSPVELALLPQQIVWYLLVGLATAGAVVGLRRDALLTWLLIGYAVVGVVLIAPNSGNIGTLVRHRDTVSPFVVWFSALGAVVMFARLDARFKWGRIGVSDVPAAETPRPRLWDRVNLIDASIGVVVLVLVPLGYAAYLLFHTPAPRITAIEPGTWMAGEHRQVQLKGRYLRPFLTVFVGKTGEPIVLLDRHDRPTEGGYLLRTADSAVVEMPGLAPATYDLVLFENAQEVARKDAAFTVLPPPPSVDARVRFVVHPDMAPLVKVGDRDQPTNGEPDQAVLLAFDEREAKGQVTGILERVVVLEATLRIPVTKTTEGWRYRGRLVRAGSELPFETPRYALQGWILGVAGPDRSGP